MGGTCIGGRRATARRRPPPVCHEDEQVSEVDTREADLPPDVNQEVIITARKLTRFAVAVAATVGSLASAPAIAQIASPAVTRPRDVVVNMRDVDIAQVAEQVSRLTAKTIILDPAVKGVVNVVSAEPLSPDGVWDLFRSVLRVHGFAAVRSGAAWRVIPQASAVQGGATAAIGPGSARPADVVTRVVPLRNSRPTRRCASFARSSRRSAASSR